MTEQDERLHDPIPKEYRCAAHGVVASVITWDQGGEPVKHFCTRCILEWAIENLSHAVVEEIE